MAARASSLTATVAGKVEEEVIFTTEQIDAYAAERGMKPAFKYMSKEDTEDMLATREEGAPDDWMRHETRSEYEARVEAVLRVRNGLGPKVR